MDLIHNRLLAAAALSTLALFAAQPGPPQSCVTWCEEVDAPYLFVPGDVTPIDGVTSIAPTGGTAGRWLLGSDRISIASIGAGDAARISTVRNACSGKAKIEYRASATWLWDSAHQMPDNLVEEWLPGSTITSTLAADGTELNAPFNANRAVIVRTTTNAVTTVGSRVIPVTATAGITVGSYVRILEIAPKLAASIYLVTAVAAGVSITADRPVQRVFASGSAVDSVTPPLKIQIHGNGLNVRGTGDRAVEIVGGWRCLVEGLDVLGFSDYIVGYDLGCYGCVFRDIVSNGNGVSLGAFTFESSEECEAYNIEGKNSAGVGAGGGFFLWGSVNCRVFGGFFHDNTGDGALLTVGSATDTRGNLDCKFFGSTFSHNGGDGVGIIEGNTGTEFHGCNANDNSLSGFRLDKVTTASAGTRWFGGGARRNPGNGIFVAGASIDNKAFGMELDNNTQEALRCDSGTIDMIDCYALDTGALAAQVAIVMANGADAIIRWIGGRIRSTSATNTRGIIVQGAGRVEALDCTIEAPANNAEIAVYNSNGTFIGRRVSLIGRTAAGYGYYCNGGVTGTLSECNFSTANTPYTQAGSTIQSPTLRAGCTIKAYPSDANYTATAAEFELQSISLTTGAIANPRNFVLPHWLGCQWSIHNGTNQTITVIGPSGTGVALLTGTGATVFSDGTNFLAA